MCLLLHRLGFPHFICGILMACIYTFQCFCAFSNSFCFVYWFSFWFYFIVIFEMGGGVFASRQFCFQNKFVGVVRLILWFAAFYPVFWGYISNYVLLIGWGVYLPITRFYRILEYYERLTALVLCRMFKYFIGVSGVGNF